MKIIASETHKKTIGIIIIVFAVIVSLISYLYVGIPMIKLVETPELFRNWVDSRGVWGNLAFIGMVAFQVIFAVIPGEPLEIGAGYAFGAVEGTILTIIGALIGSLIVFYLSRRFGMSFVTLFVSKEKITNLKFLKYSKKRNLIIFILFAVPGTPKDILSYFVGLTDIKLSFWVFITTVGRIPSIITSTIGGDLIGEQKHLIAIIVFVISLLISGIGLMVYKTVCKYNNKN